VIQNGWSVHFIGPDGKTRIGPWLLLDSHEEVLAIFRWGEVSAEELEDPRGVGSERRIIVESLSN
jgi:hypothetical protein